eukprot:scaffold61183_cov62-Phaeocystis_antarctica.AAC.2
MLREPAQRESDTWLDSDRKQPALRGREREGHHGCAGVAYRAGPRLAAVGRRRYRTRKCAPSPAHKFAKFGGSSRRRQTADVEAQSNGRSVGGGAPALGHRTHSDESCKRHGAASRTWTFCRGAGRCRSSGAQEAEQR